MRLANYAALLLAVLMTLGCVKWLPAMVLKTDVCDGLSFQRRGNDLLFICPGKPEPWGVWRDAYVACPRLRVHRQNGELYLTCNN